MMKHVFALAVTFSLSIGMVCALDTNSFYLANKDEIDTTILDKTKKEIKEEKTNAKKMYDKVRIDEQKEIDELKQKAKEKALKEKNMTEIPKKSQEFNFSKTCR